ncbi:hypothetical protein R3P38DRAFT_2892391 [Favolaschia claudopus]|uniref:F-box domain-containing protein n=1 Tax=Favolaschia claudopus TaxID=2862362 RepID=A0AAW0CVR2_9AGAR
MSQQSILSDVEQEKLVFSAEAAALRTLIETLRSKALLGTRSAKLPHVTSFGDDQELQATRKKLADTRRSLDVLSQRIATHNRLSSVVARIPVEILCHIFFLTLGSNRPFFINRQAFSAPWGVTHVCRAWRRAARGDPHLWSYMDINTNDYPETRIPISKRLPLAALQAQLQLSSHMNLYIEIFVGDPVIDRVHWIALLEALVPHSDRWASLQLRWDSKPDIFHVFKRAKGHLSNLKFLRLDSLGAWDSVTWPRELMDMFVRTPCLQTVLLTDRELDKLSAPLEFGLGWPSLTHLRISSASAFILGVLRNAPNLVECGLDETSAGTLPVLSSGAPSIIHLPRLRRLVCYGAYFFRHVQFPALQCLEIGFVGDLTRVPESLERSQCQLRTLRFGMRYFGSAPILAVLRQAAGVSHVEFDFTWHDCFRDSDTTTMTHVLRALDNSASPSLCPKLTTFQITLPEQEIDVPIEIQEELCNMVESRWNLPIEERALKSVGMSPMRLSPSIRARLDSLQFGGLDLNEATLSTFDGEFEVIKNF